MSILIEGTDITARRLLESLSLRTSYVDHELRLVGEAGPGLAERLNKAADAARGEYLLFVRADAVLADDWVEALLEHACQAEIGVAGGHLLDSAGRIVDADRPGTAIHQGGLLAKLQYDHEQIAEIRSPIPGRIRTVAQPGANVAAGAEIAVVDPGTEQVWEALRALYIIGQMEDLAAIRPYERDVPDVSNDVRQQATETDKAIRARAGVT